VIGIPDADNQIVIDENRRAESPMAIDDHIVDESEHEGLLLGDKAVPFNPEAEHLADVALPRDPERGLTNELAAESRLEDVGTTHDLQDAIEGGEPWTPPDSPTPEGVGGPEDGTFGADGAH
jgi:hypothetical protein